MGAIFQWTDILHQCCPSRVGTHAKLHHCWDHEIGLERDSQRTEVGQKMRR